MPKISHTKTRHAQPIPSLYIMSCCVPFYLQVALTSANGKGLPVLIYPSIVIQLIACYHERVEG